MEKNNKLNIFWHICSIGSWKDIVSDQIGTILSSGLYNEVEKIYVTFLGDPNIDLAFLTNHHKIEIKNKSRNIKLYESLCLNDMKNWCENNDSRVLYIHSKGASRTDWEYRNVWEWRKMMEYFLVENWRQCVDSLDIYDTVGCNLSSRGFGQHYSGNFWWSKSSYLSGLEEIRITNEDLWFWRCETWIMSGNPNSLEIYRDKKTQHYYDSSPKNYKNTESCIYREFIEKWNNLLRPWRRSTERVKEMLVDYVKICKDLMSQDEEVIVEMKELLLKNIEAWAIEKSKLYKNKPSSISKNDLTKKENWYVEEICDESYKTKTSGSSSGCPFEYLRWERVFHDIEWDNHYNLVLDEFDVNHNPQVLYFFSGHYKTNQDEIVYCPGESSELAMNNHGSLRSPIVHYANFEIYKRDPEYFFKNLFTYIKKNKIDVFFSSSPEINSMCNYMRKFGFKGKVAYLLSNTSEMLMQQDAYFLFENNHFDHICDHMRCWDGGGSFFTCKYRNYHLMDNLAWCEQGPNNEFICTDYFNLASPFVRYWNGDYCKIDNEYKRCECGRLYREFEFLENRPFSLKGVCFKEIKEKIKELGIEGIKQVRCSPETLDVVSSRPLNDAETRSISMLTDKFQFRFKVEAD